MTPFRNVHNSLSSQCFNFLNDETFTDLILIADGRFLNCHKIVLAAASNYFKEILTLLTDKTPAIVLKDISYKHLQQVMTYIYCGTVDIPEKEVATFRNILDSLKIQYDEDDEEIDEELGREPETEITEPSYDSSAFTSFSIKEEPKDDFSIDFTEESTGMDTFDESHSSKPPDDKEPVKCVVTFSKNIIKPPGTKIMRFQTATDGKVSLGKVVPNRKLQEFMSAHPSLCPFCQKLFKTTKHRNEHVKYCFDNPNRVVSNCPICGKSVCDPYYLRKHMRNVHGQETPVATTIKVVPFATDAQ